MTRPSVHVAIAFDSTYSTAAASRTWTDVTDYVLASNGIGIGYGRQDEFSQAGPNTCSLTLDNSDGRFTPDLASGAYYPNVKIGRPLRVTANLCSFGDYGTFEADDWVAATDWQANNGTSARTTDQAHSGSASLAATADGAGNMFVNTPGAPTGIPVIAGETYRASAWYRRGGVSRTCELRVAWLDAAGVVLSTSTSSSIGDTLTWQQIVLEAEAPTDAAFARVRPFWFSPLAAEVHYVDDIRLDVDRFVGYIDEWPLEWPGVVDTFATAAITATSRMARLGLSAKRRSVIEEEYLLDAPSAYYTMGEAEGATRANDSSGNEAPALIAITGDGAGDAQPIFGTATGPGTDSLTAVQVNSTTRRLRADLDSATFAAVGFFFSYDSAPAIEATILDLRVGGGGDAGDSALWVVVLSTGELYVEPDTAGAGAMTSSMDVADGQTRHIFIKQNGANVELWVDGVLDDTVAKVAGTYDRLAVVNVETPTLAIAHVALFDTAPSSTRIADHADAGLTGFPAEPAVDRLTRYAGYAGIPTAEQDFDTDAETPMAHIDTTDQGAVELMQTVATTDGGALYDSTDGTSTYVARTARYTADAALTLDVDAGEVEVGYQPKVDRSALINKLTATLTDGTHSVTALNAASITEYGEHGPGDLELATTDTDEAHAAAWWRVNTYGEPSARAPQLSVELAKMSTAQHAAVLAVTVSDKVTVTNLPAQSDSASKSFFIEGWTETFTDTLHRIDFNVTPATGFDVWTVGDATYGVYDAYPIAY
jgi:hypothetical protein